MTVEFFAKELGLKKLCMPLPERKIEGAYIGDLLSWVMGKAESGNIWITIMSNINIVAVATLADISAIVLAEGVTLEEEIVNTAKEKGINILSTPLSAYEIAKKVSGII